MKRPIKFRGKCVDNGEFVYGDFGRAANTGEPVIYFIDDERNWVGATVDEDSVAQLVGYDCDGAEVYEGDIVIEEYLDDYTCEHVARLESMSQNPETAAYYFWTYPTKCKLKEATS